VARQSWENCSLRGRVWCLLYSNAVVSPSNRKLQQMNLFEFGYAGMDWWERGFIGGAVIVWAIILREPAKKVWGKLRTDKSNTGESRNKKS